jgi:AraC family transcriptional regulator of arabinose operon
MRIENFNTTYSNNELKFCYCGYEDCTDDFNCGPNVRNCWLIHLVVKGKGYYLLNNKKYEINVGDIFVIFPNEVVYYNTDEESPWSFYWFAFNGSLASYYLNKMQLTSENPVATINEYEKMAQTINKLIQVTIPNSIRNSLLISAYLNEILGIMYNQLLNLNGTISLNSSNNYIEKAVLFIEYNYSKGITSIDVSDYINIERTYFSKIFKKNIGISPQKYIINCRIQQAINLLKTTDYTVCYIAQSVGFPNINYFFRKFKCELGITPVEYRGG